MGQALRREGGRGEANMSLFAPAPIPGVMYRADYIDRDIEAALFAFVDGQAWDTEIKRRTQVYGGQYAAIRPAQGGGPLPEAFLPLAECLRRDGYFPDVPDLVIVNNYDPGQGIGAHTDRGGHRIETVAIVSLGSALMLDFTRDGHEAQSFYLRPRSLLVMQGEARHLWQHGIAPRHNDRVGGLVLPRGRRVSVTFRLGKGDGT